MNYKYNEKEYAKIIYEKGIQDINFLPTELRLVATYLRRDLDKKPKQVREDLIKWCEETSGIKDFKIEKYYKIINKAINQATKKGSCLIQVDEIEIYNYEMDYIDNLNIESEYEYECKKVIFTLLCKAKLNKLISNQRNSESKEEMSLYFQGGTRKYNELKKQSNLSQKAKINENIFYDLSKNELITPMFNGLIVLNFIKDINDLEKEIVGKETKINIKFFEDFGYYYDYYHNAKGIKQCQNCGKIIKIKSKTCPPKYCDECFDKIRKEKRVEYNANYYEKCKEMHD